MAPVRPYSWRLSVITPRSINGPELRELVQRVCFFFQPENPIPGRGDITLELYFGQWWFILRVRTWKNCEASSRRFGESIKTHSSADWIADLRARNEDKASTGDWISGCGMRHGRMASVQAFLVINYLKQNNYDVVGCEKVKYFSKYSRRNFLQLPFWWGGKIGFIMFILELSLVRKSSFLRTLVWLKMRIGEDTGLVDSD